MELNTAGVTIWLALNDVDLCAFSKDYLRHKGCSCRCFGHYLALAEALSHQTPSALIIDEDFADKTTPQLVEWLQKHVSRHTGIVMVSRVSAIHHQHHNAIRQLEKVVELHHPFTTSELVAALHAVLDAVLQTN